MNNVADILKQIPREEIHRAVQRRLFEVSFFEFVKWAAKQLEPQTDFKWGFYHEYICDILQEETIRIKNKEPKKKNIIINVPFRSSKSLIVSVFYPIWSWIVNPQMEFINLSYSADLSTDHSNKVIALLSHPKFRELYDDWDFVETHKSKTDFKLKRGGTRMSGGFTGSILGHGGDVIIMDDPNSPKQLSNVERHNTIKAWVDTISTRLNNPDTGIFILIQQRLHQEDLTGYLLNNEPDNWEHVVFPAELTDKVRPIHLAAKYVDNLLQPERFSKKVLDNFRKVLGSVGYSNQLLQEATTAEGNIIKRNWIIIKPIETILDLKLRWEMIVDTAQTEKKKNDPSGILIFAKHNNSIIVRKIIEKRFQFPDLVDYLVKIYEEYRIKRIWVEPKSSGLDVINYLKRKTNVHISNLPAPTDDKLTRLNAASPFIEDGKLILIEDASNSIIIEQLTGFPQVIHDEAVDLVSYSVNNFLNKNKGLNYKFIN